MAIEAIEVQVCWLSACPLNVSTQQTGAAQPARQSAGGGGGGGCRGLFTGLQSRGGQRVRNRVQDSTDSKSFCASIMFQAPAPVGKRTSVGELTAQGTQVPCPTG